MTDYTWPTDIVPSSSTWLLVANTASFAAPLSGTTRTLARGGDRWACTLTCNNLVGAKRAILQAFVARLRGQAHRVVLPDHAYNRRGTQATNVLVKGASQTGSSLIVDGGTNTNTLLAGDMITVAGYLYMVVVDATFNSSTDATLTITPPLRTSPADNAVVYIATPTARFLLSDNTVSWSNVPGGPQGPMSSFSLSFVEDLAA